MDVKQQEANERFTQACNAAWDALRTYRRRMDYSTKDDCDAANHALRVALADRGERE